MAEGVSRRGFLTARPAPAFRPSPPGTDAAALAACTGCGDCVAACPQQILLVVGGRVAIDFDSGECTFCNACAEPCPEPVFILAPTMAHHAAISDACLARRGTTCMSCRDACPEDAIRFAPRMGGPFLPALSATACTGCGACVAPCPADAITMRQKDPAHA
ncbi:ferredoxin-type protein NapF [Paracoccus sp. 12-3]|nr:ferredoxin-type protein NapF [Paracoccus xiamenensis]